MSRPTETSILLNRMAQTAACAAPPLPVHVRNRITDLFAGRVRYLASQDQAREQQQKAA